jgi:hypothetical protein
MTMPPRPDPEPDPGDPEEDTEDDAPAGHPTRAADVLPLIDKEIG